MHRADCSDSESEALLLIQTPVTPPSPAVTHRLSRHFDLAHARRDPDEENFARPASAAASTVAATSRPYRALAHDHQAQMADRALALTARFARLAEMFKTIQTQQIMGLLRQQPVLAIPQALLISSPAAMPPAAPRPPDPPVPRLAAAAAPAAAPASTAVAVADRSVSSSSSSSRTARIVRPQGPQPVPSRPLRAVGPVTRLHSDALESIFSFLTLVELHRGFSVDRRWSTVLRRMGCRTGVEMRVAQGSGALARLSAALQSPLARLVARLAAHKSTRRDQLGGFLSLDSPADLRLLAPLRRLAWLRCRPSPALLGGPALPAFPSSLTRLDLLLGGGALAAAVNLAIGAAAALPSLTSLSVNLPAKRLAALDLSPLRLCGPLRVLSIQLARGAAPAALMPESFLAQLRSLPRLHQLSVTHLGGDALRRLCAEERPRLPWRPPPQVAPLLWRRLDVDACPSELALDDGMAGLIAARMPALEELRVVWPVLSCASLGWLGRLPRLRRLRINVSGCPPAALTADALSEALRPCTEIESVALVAADGEVHWPAITALFGPLPSLAEIALADRVRGKGRREERMTREEWVKVS